MKQIVWKERFNINFGEIDDQHKELIEIINKFINIINDSSQRDQIPEIIRMLTNYAMFHFTYEENFMKKAMYPELAAHKKEHQAFIKKILYFDREFDPGNDKFLYEVLDFLKDWYLDHIMTTDKKYQPYFKDLDPNE